MPVAIASTYDKRGLPIFIEGLAVGAWEVYAAPSDQAACFERTGRRLPSLSSFVEAHTQLKLTDEAAIAREIVRLMCATKSVDLVCVNLGPIGEGEEIPSGLLMIDAAIVSNTLVVTNPDSYNELRDNIDRLDSGWPSVERLIGRLATEREDHIAERLADSLIAHGLDLY